MSNETSNEDRTGLEIAVIGMAGRFPGARDVRQFWRNVRDGVESITELTEEQIVAAGGPKEAVRSPRWVRKARIFEDWDRFDASFFAMSPREADLIDPQHRVFLETAWEALEDAGYDADRLGVPVGVFAGSRFNGYLLNVYSNQSVVRQAGDFQVQLSNDKDYIATRVSYKLDLGGPSMTVQTACSTALVAVHLACQALNSGECGMALAGGVGVRVPEVGYPYVEGDVGSPDGHVRPFDAKASGTMFGSGAGAVLLKRLEDALRDGDTVRAVIRGSAVTNDGAAKVGFSAPGVDGQYRAVRAAQLAAEVDAESIGFVEAHGTGTLMGDPIEVEALTRAFRDTTERRGYCALASVKGNIGHMGAAAGAASLIKTVLALEHGEIPASILFDRPNPQIDFPSTPFFVPTELREWPRNGAPRRAGVSAFGIGGTNAHVVLEEAPPAEPASPSRPRQLLLLSARSREALETQARNLAARLEEAPGLDLADVAYTLQVGRRVHPHRMAVVAGGREEALAALRGDSAGATTVGYRPGRRPSIAFLFSGQGAQYPGMTRGLYEREPVYREALDRCLELLAPHLEADLKPLLFPAPGDEESAAEALGRTAFTQPALFAVEYSLAQLWRAWGIVPDAMAGHSIGEYVAACLAGVFRLEDALGLVAARGRLMQELPPGAMLAVPLSEEEAGERLDGGLSIAALNAPGRCVVSGPADGIAALRERLEAEGKACRPLHTSHAFHSAMMEPILGPFLECFEGIPLGRPAIPFVSNVTGTWIGEDEATDPGYWARHLRGTVRFADGVGELLAAEDRLLLEVGPGNGLVTLARRHPARRAEQPVIATARHPKEPEDDQAFLLERLGQLWIAGAAVDWAGFYGGERRRRVPLPTYPFERQRFWIEAWGDGSSRVGAGRSAEKKEDLADWFYVPAWKPSMFAAPAGDLAEAPRTWLLLAGADVLSAAVEARLRGHGQRVVRVEAGEGFERSGDGSFRIAPGERKDYDALVKALVSEDRLPDVLVHLWNVGPERPLAAADLASGEERAFWSQLFLAQSLGRQGVDRPIRWLTVSSGLQRVRGEATLAPERALLLGPVKVIPSEYPNLRCRSLDVALPGDGEGSEAAGELADVVLAEATGEAEDRVVAARDGERWVLGYEAVRLGAPEAGSLAIRDRGVYLVTGGLGGIGLTFAEYLAREHRARLVLLGLSALPERSDWEEWLETHGAGDRTSDKIRKVRRLEELGAEVLALSADVADPERMTAVVRETVERFGAIHGVVHAAGLAGGGMIQLKAEDVAARVLSPKVRGTVVLDAALAEAGVEPDFVLLCSSTIACVGGLGQVDYCAANSFLDAWAHRERLRLDAGQTRVRTLAVNWGAWEEVGMAVAAGLVGGGSPETGKAPVSAGPVHALVDRCLREASDQTIYATDFSSERHWVLAEHRILGTPTLPGTTHLELASAVFRHHAANFEQFDPAAPVEIRDAFFLTPLMLPEGESREAQIFLERDGGWFKFRVVTRAPGGAGGAGGDGTWQPHSRGRVGPGEVAEAARVDLDAVRARCDRQSVEIDGPVMNVEGEGVVFWGAHWQCLKRIWMGEGEGLALLELPEELAAETRELALHPALLDVATGIIGFVEEDNYLPLSYGRVCIRRPLQPRIYSHLRQRTSEATRETLAVDVTITDEAGEVLVEIERFAMKKVGAAAASFQRSAAPGGREKPSAPAPAPEGADGARQEATAPASAPAPVQAPADGGILPAEGVEVFRRVLSRRVRAPQVIATAKDLFFLIEQTDQLTRERLMAGSGEARSPQSTHDRPSLPTPYVAPRTEAERALAEIWQAALGIREIGIHDNFFDLGGDSVMGIQLVARVNESGYELSPDQLFEHQTVAELATVLGGDATEERPAAEAWEEWLREQASGSWGESLDYWLSEERLSLPGLPSTDGASSERRTVTSGLDPETSRQLLGEALPELRATLEEAALAAVTRVVSRAWGSDRLLIRLRGDGREVAPRELGLAAHETPLPYHFPAVIDLAGVANDGLAALVRAVKEQRRAVPHGGAPWFALLHLSLDPAAGQRLEAMPAPQVALWVAEAGDAPAQELAPAAIEIRVATADDRVDLEWSFDPAVLEPATAEALAAEARDLLRRIAGETGAAAVSPSDFPDADLDHDALETVFSKLGN